MVQSIATRDTRRSQALVGHLALAGLLGSALLVVMSVAAQAESTGGSKIVVRETVATDLQQPAHFAPVPAQRQGAQNQLRSMAKPAVIPTIATETTGEGSSRRGATGEVQQAAPVDATTYLRMRAQARARQVNFQTAEQEDAQRTAEAEAEFDASLAKDPCAAMPAKSFDQYGISIAMPDGQFPTDNATACWGSINEADGPLAGSRYWGTSTFAWEATRLCHRPLYFEQTNLERYGYGCCECVQPAVAAAHFFGTIPALPYCMAVDCPGECKYTLGQYRPGDCVPRQCTWPPCSPRAILAEGGVWTGMIFLIP